MNITLHARRTTRRSFHIERLESRVQLSTSTASALAIQLISPAAIPSFNQLATASGATLETTSIPGLVQVRGDSSSLAAISAAAAGNPDVQYTEPVQTVQTAVAPNDP